MATRKAQTRVESGSALHPLLFHYSKQLRKAAPTSRWWRNEMTGSWRSIRCQTPRTSLRPRKDPKDVELELKEVIMVTISNCVAGRCYS